MTSTDGGTSYVVDDGGSNDEFDMDPPRELSLDDLPHKRRDHTSLSLDSSELEVSKEFSSKDSFLGALKQYSIINRVHYHVVKSKSVKFKAKCAV
ncbi:hypothetical protein PVK06_043927 [Gossypium arboreum]|uniref:Transposase MuDR plant domain-containing protein n=1 Tax=Gossypium arboreum TaxID=29729 RepID=A0ABR0MPQ8_GOSAR|nr:hypothetical protein PVK06_043927 [Gossypium arboreum]